ncbi:hypothetical protein WOLCODRAFT_104748 [Wolfiporia cocos MD-104 SS10]|uniref:Oxo-4-hydroxy-4-carboxy-5-ureidoimidazoline decarboxylase domain-containing protein n=1 Tax=Wolfiporia cocos (strain MD-104) TaxID=742152 RepID=A0A2H3JZ56_WOLCO|nr:hypothetical protein WOLCODRAFT_104748 [Wolfiporia cocos MD-104 SS10]
MAALPPLNSVLASGSDVDDPLASALATLFEPSPILYSDLVPGLAAYIPASSRPIAMYSDLIDASLAVISTWSDDLKAQFIAGHPRIGEVKGLSHLSAKEQAAAATPPEVLARLAHLNACYEYRYPGLRYITFVNRRTRAMIKDEMEGVLRLEPSLSSNQPVVETVGRVEVAGEEWKKELERAVVDVGKIAKSRLKSLGVD